ncbi:hypothetical protein HX871_32740, partial [Pseudomonas reactans]
ALEAAQVPAIVRGPLVAAAAQQPGEPVFVDDTDGVRRAYAAMVVPHAAGGHLRIVRGVDATDIVRQQRYMTLAGGGAILLMVVMLLALIQMALRRMVMPL